MESGNVKPFVVLILVLIVSIHQAQRYITRGALWLTWLGTVSERSCTSRHCRRIRRSCRPVWCHPRRCACHSRRRRTCPGCTLVHADHRSCTGFHLVPSMGHCEIIWNFYNSSRWFDIGSGLIGQCEGPLTFRPFPPDRDGFVCLLVLDTREYYTPTQILPNVSL